MPDSLGRYELIEKIGKGGMGAVHRARDPRMKRDVAIKTLLHIDDLATRKRFHREVQAAAALNHANIVAVYDCELDGNSPFIVMEFVAGESLDRKLQRGRIPLSEAIVILRETAIALDFAHGEGIVHRDVKPGNVMIGRNGRIKLADFGIARILNDDSTHAGMDPGTPKYMAPEVLSGVKGVAASDQFSFAVMAFQMLTGARPFDSDVPWGLFNQIVNQPAPAPTSVDPTLPKPLDAVLLRALSKNPAERYPSCTEFVHALVQVFREADNQVTVTAPNIIIGPVAGEVRENPKDGLKYVWIPPGSFQMGRSPGDEEGWGEEDPPHLVTISKGFWIGRTPVTVAAWKRFAQATGRNMPEAPTFNTQWALEGQPIVNVSWHDTQAYCKWADVRLPTEAEWEYAARAGVEVARYGHLDDIAWYLGNSGGAAHEVARKRPNAFGLYDVLGNVWEWVADWYSDNHYRISESDDPKGPATGAERAFRGGSWSNDPWRVRLSNRDRVEPSRPVHDVGFRCLGDWF